MGAIIPTTRYISLFKPCICNHCTHWCLLLRCLGNLATALNTFTSATWTKNDVRGWRKTHSKFYWVGSLEKTIGYRQHEQYGRSTGLTLCWTVFQVSILWWRMTFVNLLRWKWTNDFRGFWTCCDTASAYGSFEEGGWPATCCCNKTQLHSQLGFLFLSSHWYEAFYRLHIWKTALCIVLTVKHYIREGFDLSDESYWPVVRSGSWLR